MIEWLMNVQHFGGVQIDGREAKSSEKTYASATLAATDLT
jgi:hypothetical protein